MTLKIVAVAALLALLASPALASGQLPDGTYQCTMDEHLQGEMIIAGKTYQGPAYDGQYDGTFPFTIVDNNIDLQGTKGIYEDPTIQFIGALLVDDGKGHPAIEYHVKLQGSDTVHIGACTLE